MLEARDPQLLATHVWVPALLQGSYQKFTQISEVTQRWQGNCCAADFGEFEPHCTFKHIISCVLCASLLIGFVKLLFLDNLSELIVRPAYLALSHPTFAVS